MQSERGVTVLPFINTAFAEGETQAAAPNWFQTAFKKLGELEWWGWIIVAVLLFGGAAAFVSFRQQKKHWSAQMIAVGAICMALSTVLSMIRLYRMPQGGSITPASMLPMMLFAYTYGLGPGLLLGAVYGMLQFLLGPEFLSLPQMLLDYPIAYMMMGLVGLFNKQNKMQPWLSIGIVIASAGRILAATVSGAVFFAEYAEGTGMNPWIYSLVYNGSYLLPECVICVILALIVAPRVVRMLHRMR